MGWADEEAVDRLARLAAEEGWSVRINNLYGDTAVMGAQPIGKLSEVLKQIERSEDGLLTDMRGNVALLFRTRYTQYNQAGMALTYGTGIKSLKPVIDDQGTRNDVLVKNADGLEARSIEDDGPMSVSDSPTGVGRYPATIDVNVMAPTEDLQLIADWWRKKGTVEAARYPVVTLDLDANPALAPEAYRLTSGDRVTITGLEYDLVDLRVLGGREVLGSHELKLAFNCDPGQQWQVGEYDDTVRRYDLRSCTVASLASSTTNTISLTITDNEAWSTVDEPYDLMIAGERVRVTSMGARSGSGPYSQTATVTRGINGVTKELPSGSEVHIATPGRWAL
jgi:hypothetical protein